MSTNPRKRSKTTPGTAWFKLFACQEQFGYVLRSQTPHYQNPTTAILDAHNFKSYFNHKKGRREYCRTRKITNYMFDNHNNRTHNLYYTNKFSRDGEMLIMIDIDVNKSLGEGSKEGAYAFAIHLRGIFGQQLYIEPSTSGNSFHCYLRIRNNIHYYKDVINALKHLEKFLTSESKKNNFDIELVELKGHPGIIIYENRTAKTVKFGQLAKVPFGLKDRLEELQKTSVVTIDEILSDKFKIKEEKLERKKSGSISGNFVKKVEIEKMKIYEEIFDSMFGDKIKIKRSEKTQKSQNWNVDKKYFAATVLIMRFIKANNPKNSSTKRFEEIWKALYNAGDLEICWNKKVFLYIKSLLNDRGFIHWVDNRFDYRSVSGGKGVATEWVLSDQFEEKTEVMLKDRHNSDPSCGLQGLGSLSGWKGSEVIMKSVLWDFYGELNQRNSEPWWLADEFNFGFPVAA
jgi:hypothetical protein